MPKVKISEYSATANSNTDVASINIDEGCAPSGINNAIRAVMGHLKDFQQGTYGDPFNGPVNGTLGATTASTANVTTLTTSSTVTHNGGTANGVAYLNGSKVLTTGSALVFDGSNLGIGTTSPGNKLTVKPSATSSGTLDVLTGSTNTDSVRISGGGTVNTWLEMRGYLGVKLYSDATNTVTVDASGNLGIGTTSPSFRLHAVSSAAVVSRIGSSGGSGAFINFIDSGASPSVAPSVGAIGNSLVFMGDGSSSERARIDSSGNLLVGTTGLGTIGSSSGSTITASGAIYSASTGESIFSRRSTDGDLLLFRRDTTQVGSISVTTTATAYNTSSDYRLKHDIQPMTGALAKVAQLKPVTYKWKVDGSDGEGFIAHELAEVVPQCVTGEKDAVDANGNPVYQGIDTSFLVATLTAAIQELKAEFDAYKATHP